MISALEKIGKAVRVTTAVNDTSYRFAILVLLFEDANFLVGNFKKMVESFKSFLI